MRPLFSNKRIAINVFASYLRSLYSIAIGLISGRWVLISLGQEDYGLYGVIGGMTIFVSFFNGLLASAVSRFYAFQVGAASLENEEDGVDSCRKWFNTALMMHSVLAVVLVIIGYPIGDWAVKSYLTIPTNRVESCVVIWRFVCLSCFIGMISVPFRAMYTAKQEIAELTIYSFATTTCNALFLYYMVTHPAFWLTRYAAWMCLLACFPQVIISVRAIYKYRECRFVKQYLWNVERIKELINYAGGRLICSLAQTLSIQSLPILVNKKLGPTQNAAMSISGNVNGQCLTLADAFAGALTPAITNAAGACDYERMRKFIYASCSVACVSMLIFSIPLALEIDEVLLLWLKIPPEGTAIMCVCMLGVALVDRMTDGLWIGIFAMGKVFAFQTAEAVIWLFLFPMAFILVGFNWGLFGVGIAFFIDKVLDVFVKLYYARKFCEISIRYWCLKIAVPIFAVSFLAAVSGMLVVCALPPSFMRIVITTICVELVLLPLAWFLVLSAVEREMILTRISSAVRKIRLQS